MTSLSEREDRWQHLVACAFALRESPDDLAPLLSSLAEVFPSSLDPVDDFEGYAVRRFVLALREAVDQRANGQTSGMHTVRSASASTVSGVPTRTKSPNR